MICAAQASTSSAEREAVPSSSGVAVKLAAGRRHSRQPPFPASRHPQKAVLAFPAEDCWRRQSSEPVSPIRCRPEVTRSIHSYWRYVHSLRGAVTIHPASGPAPPPLRVPVSDVKQTLAVCWICAGSRRYESGVEGVGIRQPSS